MRITSEHNSINFKISELILNYSPECILNTHADSKDWVDGWINKGRKEKGRKRRGFPMVLHCQCGLCA